MVRPISVKNGAMTFTKVVFIVLAGAVVVSAAIAGVMYRAELRNAVKLLARSRPAYAAHIPNSSLVVARMNLAVLALKTGLRGSQDDPTIRILHAYGSKLYAGFDQLLADPVKETGIEVADDVYAFLEFLDNRKLGSGVLFGIADQTRFAEFIRKTIAVPPASEGALSSLRLNSDTMLVWNKSFGLMYTGGENEQGIKRSREILNLDPGHSMSTDARKKKWLDGNDDLLATLDLDLLSKTPEVSAMFRDSLLKAETYVNSSLGFAFNFDTGKFSLALRADGAALAAETNRIFDRPSKEFLSAIKTDNYQGFFSTHIKLLPLLDAVRQANPLAYKSANEFVMAANNSSIEQMAESFTGDVCIVLTAFKWDPTQTTIDGIAVIGIKNDSPAVKFVRKSLEQAPAKDVQRDGSLYSISRDRPYYLLADNGYLALSTQREPIKALVDYKKGDNPVMPASLVDKAASSFTLLDLKIASLVSMLGKSLPSYALQSDTDRADALFSSLQISTNATNDQVVTQFDLYFKDATKNSLNQLAAVSMRTMSEYQVKASNAAALADLRNATTSLEAYYDYYRRYPVNVSEANVVPSREVELVCMNTALQYECISKHREGDRFYAKISNEPFVRTKRLVPTDEPIIPLGPITREFERM